MKLLLIILSIIGLLKLASLFILCIVEILNAKNENIHGIHKEYGIYKTDDLYIIPTINFTRTGKYIEIMFYWLCFEYYSNYYIEEDES